MPTYAPPPSMQPRPAGKPVKRRDLPVWLVMLAMMAGLVVLGVLWVKKENWNKFLSREILEQVKEEKRILTEAGRLQAEYLSLTETTTIENQARAKLNMVFPKQLPDTVRVPAEILPKNYVFVGKNKKVEAVR